MQRRLLLAFLVASVRLPLVRPNTVAGTETLVGIVGKDFVLLGADSSVSSSIALTASNLDKIAVLVDPFPDSKQSSPLWSQQVVCAAAAGDSADCDRLLSILRSQLAIAEFEEGVGCDVEVVDCSNKDPKLVTNMYYQSSHGMDADSLAQLARTIIVENLRRSPFKACLLVAGMVGAQRVTTQKNHVAMRVQDQVASVSLPFLPNPDQLDSIGRRRNLEQVKNGLLPVLFWLDEYGAAQNIDYGAHGYGSNLILSILDQGYRHDMSRQEATDLMIRCFEQLRVRYTINSPNPPCIKCVDSTGCTLIR